MNREDLKYFKIVLFYRHDALPGRERRALYRTRHIHPGSQRSPDDLDTSCVRASKVEQRHREDGVKMRDIALQHLKDKGVASTLTYITRVD